MAEIVLELLFGRIGGQELGVDFPVLFEPLGEHWLYPLRRDLAEKGLEHLDYQLELCAVVDLGFSHLHLGLVAFGHLLLGFDWGGHKVEIAVDCGGSLGPDPHAALCHEHNLLLGLAWGSCTFGLMGGVVDVGGNCCLPVHTLGCLDTLH